MSKASFVSLSINIVGAALALVFPSLSFTELATTQSTQTICGFTVPSGYVAVSYRNQFGCSTGGTTTGNNATVIQTPYSGQTICGFTVPSGYVAVSYRNQFGCSIGGTATGNNATVIRTLTPTPTPTSTPTPISTSTPTPTPTPTPKSIAPIIQLLLSD